MPELRLGTRGSLLALTQSRAVAAAVEAATGARVLLQIIQTTGDQRLDRPLAALGGRGLFTKELDTALLEGAVDFAVHSLKDLPTRMDPRLRVAAVPEREDPRDVLIGPVDAPPVSLSGLPPGARVGTSSLRRRALCLAFRPDLEVVDVRGNLDTRLNKLDRGEMDALVLAAAGIRRLGWGRRVGEWVEGGAWLPAPGQGALGVVTRAGDTAVSEVLRPLHHPPSDVAVRAERALLQTVEGGCQVPVGALAIVFGRRVRLRGVVASLDGGRVVVADGTGEVNAPESLGRQVASLLLERGGDEILEEIRRSTAPGVQGP